MHNLVIWGRIGMSHKCNGKLGTNSFHSVWHQWHKVAPFSICHQKFQLTRQFRHSRTFMTDPQTDKRGGRQLSAAEPGRQMRHI